jgi:hypothetical protein
MGERQKKRSAAFWATVAVVALVGYLLGFGVTEWLDGNHYLPKWGLEAQLIVFWPIFWMYDNGAQPLRDAIYWYASLWNYQLPH